MGGRSPNVIRGFDKTVGQRHTIVVVRIIKRFQFMSKLSKYGVLASGILSPLAALLLYMLVYGTLSRFSADLEKDWLFRLSLSTLAMTVPFFFTLALVLKDSRRHTVTLTGKIGLAIAALSLGLAWRPVSDAITRSKQSRNLGMRHVPAPLFNTLDVLGKEQRLVDHKGEVVLVNIWATWCEPCRSEMPKLERLYRARKHRGFTVFGLSDEGVEVQRKFAEQIPVSYPLLTLRGEVPTIYRDIVRYPAIFLIDRQGRLQPAPGPDQPFDKLEGTVDALLNSGP
jgi:thiol-disulfide isomerase/thioredoxin